MSKNVISLDNGLFMKLKDLQKDDSNEEEYSLLILKKLVSLVDLKDKESKTRVYLDLLL